MKIILTGINKEGLPERREGVGEAARARRLKQHEEAGYTGACFGELYGPCPGKTPGFAGDEAWIPERCRRKENRMIGKKVLGLMAVLMLLLILATPVAAADKTIRIGIPGCAA
jgi:hypothetical protein